MRTVLATLAVAALIAPAAFAAEPNANPVTPTPTQACKTLRTTMGAQFASVYKSLGACISLKSQQAAVNTQNAAKQCKAEMAMTPAEFMAAHGGKTFAQLYGVNVNHKNAYGKCVSLKASAAAQQQLAAEVSAAKKCKAMQADAAAFAASHGGKTFKEFYGTGGGKNAYGRCVSLLAKSAS